MGASVTTPSRGRVREPALSLASSSDEWLARLVGRANERAFVALYHRYREPLYRYVWSIARNEPDAQDALQSTWTRVLVALRRGQRDAPVRPWLYRIAHNETITVLRRRGHEGELLVQPPQPAPSAEESAIDREQLAQLVTDLQELAERPRSALLMRELSGLSHQEIAKALDISVGAAKQSILAARQGLADCAQGRAIDCEEICRKLSCADRRVLRGRRVRAHLKHCESCSAFAAALQDRRATLRQLVPALPPAASASLLARVFKNTGGPSAGAGLTGGGAAASSGTGLVALTGKTAATGLATKLLAAVAALATTAVTVGGLSGSSGAAHHGAGTVRRTTAAPGLSGPVSAQPRASVNASADGTGHSASARHRVAATLRRAPGPGAGSTRAPARTAPHAARPQVAPAAATPVTADAKPAVTSLPGNGKAVGHDRSNGAGAVKSNPGHSGVKANPGHSTAKTNPGHSVSSTTARGLGTAKANPGHSTAKTNPGHSTVSSTTAQGPATTVPGDSHSSAGKSLAAPGHNKSAKSPTS